MSSTIQVRNKKSNPYVKNILGCTELDQAAKAYREEYREMRTSFIMQYAPELLGDYAECPPAVQRRK